MKGIRTNLQRASSLLSGLSAACTARIIPKEDAGKIIEGLKGILEDIDAGKVEFSVHDEDIHMNVERLLTERVGDVG